LLKNEINIKNLPEKPKNGGMPDIDIIVSNNILFTMVELLLLI